MKRILSTMLSLVVVALSLGILSSPAQAHTGDLDVTAVCNTETGMYDLTAKLTTKNAAGKTGSTKWKIGNSNFTGTPSNANGMDKVPIPSSGNTTFVLGTWSIPGTTTGYGPWVYAFTTWNDGYKKGSDGQLRDKLKGDCKQSIPEKPKPINHSDSKKECVDGYQERTGTEDHVWNSNKKKWEPTGTVVWNDWTHVRGLTPAEKAELGCAKPEQPKSVERTEPGRVESCELGGVKTWTENFVTPYVWDAKTWSYILGEEKQLANTDEDFVAYTTEELEEFGCYKEPKIEEVDDDKDSCEDGFWVREGVKTTTYEFLEGQWVENEPTTEWEEWTFHSPYDDENYFAHCAPERPAPEVEVTSSTSYECGDNFQYVFTKTLEWNYVWDTETREWVLNPVADAWVTKTIEEVEVVPCPKVDKPKEKVKELVRTGGDSGGLIATVVAILAGIGAIALFFGLRGRK